MTKKPSKRIMHRFRINEISTVDRPAQTGAMMTLRKAAQRKASSNSSEENGSAMLKTKAASKLIGKRRLFADDFAYAPDEQDSSSWRLPLVEKTGEYSPKLVTAALKAVQAGMQGKAPQRYAIPDDALDSVLDKLREAWTAAYPSMSAADMPAPINPDAEPDVEEEPVVEDETDVAADDGEDPNAVDPNAASADEEVDPNAVDPNAQPKPKAKPKAKPQAGKNPFAAAKKNLAENILKRYIDPADGAKTFTEVLTICDDDKKYREVMEAAWPLISALETSLRSIIADPDLEDTAKQNMMRTSVEGFLVGVRAAMPELEEALAKALALAADKEPMMTTKSNAAGAASSTPKLDELAKQVETLTAALGVEKAAREKAEAEALVSKQLAEMSEDERSHYGKCKDEDKPTFLKMDKASRTGVIEKAKQGDETIVVEGVSIIKSVVGPAMFQVLKASEARQKGLEKAFETERAAREKIELAKRATDELGTLPGTDEDKIALLKHLDTLPEANREGVKKMFAAANKTAGMAFERVGVSRGGSLEKRAADANFEKRIDEIKATEKCGHQEAMRKARIQFPKEFADWQGSN